MRSHVVKAAHSLMLVGSLLLLVPLCVGLVMAACRRGDFTVCMLGLWRGEAEVGNRFG